MTFETYLNGLRKKHERLCGLVDSEQKRPAPNFITLTALKKKKITYKGRNFKSLSY